MTYKVILGAAAVMTLAGLAILKCALDAADDALEQVAKGNSGQADLATEYDGFITVVGL